MPAKISRAAAMAGGWPKYFTGEKCKNGHVAMRYTLSSACVECLAMHREREAGEFRKARAEREEG